MSFKTTYHCDRCGKQIDDAPWKVYRFITFKWLMASKKRTTMSCDLCKSCNEWHKKFLEGEKLVSERIEEIGEEISKLHETHVAD